MKPEITPTNRVYTLKPEDFVVSKTDTTGRITYCNRIFMKVSGYTEKELLGAQHSIIRHPDMPRGLFQLLWDSIQGEREFFAYVKNLTRDGRLCWTFANITPSYNAGCELTGYYSVRRKPSEAAIEIIKPIYAEMLAEERHAGPAEAVEASIRVLQSKLKEQGTDYEHFILEI